MKPQHHPDLWGSRAWSHAMLWTVVVLTLIAMPSCSHLQHRSVLTPAQTRAARAEAAATQVQTLERLALQRRLYR